MQNSASASFQSVLRLLVSPQVHLPLEAFPAEVTAERFEARVLPAVRDEIGALTEGLPAHLTLVRLLTCSRNETVNFGPFCAQLHITGSFRKASNAASHLCG